MDLRDYFYKHPLIFLQIGGWFSYIFIDIFGHVRVGYYLYEQSIIYGLAALCLTSIVALLNHKNNNPNVIFRSCCFILLLYTAAIIWHKIYKLVHFQPEATLSQKVSQVVEQNLLDWLQIDTMPLFLFLAWGGFYLGAKWYFAHQKQQNELTRALIDKKQAQLETLRSQLNPHFLFNVLNSIDISVLNNDKQTAHHMLNQLSGFLRSTLQQSDNDKVTVKKEFEVMQNFIAIEQLRFGDALDVRSQLDDECQNTFIPPMLLQPLVENAVKYGWSQQEKGQIDIVISRQAQTLKVVITNSKSKLESHSGTGTGLRNTRARLQLLYGSDASIVTHDRKNDFEVEVRLPWEQQL